MPDKKADLAGPGISTYDEVQKISAGGYCAEKNIYVLE
jgi:hypothetical protein